MQDNIINDMFSYIIFVFNPPKSVKCFAVNCELRSRVMNIYENMSSIDLPTICSVSAPETTCSFLVSENEQCHLHNINDHLSTFFSLLLCVLNVNYHAFVDVFSDGKLITWCQSCNLRKPPRSGHCNVCKACVSVRDHHCVW